MRKYIIAALFAATAASPALAQTADAAATNLGGFRIEGLVGYETTDVEDEGTDGLTYGVGIGFDVQSGRTVFGVEAEAMESEIDECVTGVPAAGDSLCAKVSCIKIKIISPQTKNKTVARGRNSFFTLFCIKFICLSLNKKPLKNQ